MPTRISVVTRLLLTPCSDPTHTHARTQRIPFRCLSGRKTPRWFVVETCCSDFLYACLWVLLFCVWCLVWEPVLSPLLGTRLSSRLGRGLSCSRCHDSSTHGMTTRCFLSFLPEGSGVCVALLQRYRVWCGAFFFVFVLFLLFLSPPTFAKNKKCRIFF